MERERDAIKQTHVSEFLSVQLVERDQELSGKPSETPKKPETTGTSSSSLDSHCRYVQSS